MTDSTNGHNFQFIGSLILIFLFAAVSKLSAPAPIDSQCPAWLDARCDTDATLSELVDAIGRVSGGDAVFSPRLAGFVLDAFAGAGITADLASVDEDLDRLTEREREVMRLIARGYSYKEVAKELFISIKTVETHMSSVLRKLQLSSRHELTRWASDRRLL